MAELDDFSTGTFFDANSSRLILPRFGFVILRLFSFPS